MLYLQIIHLFLQLDLCESYILQHMEFIVILTEKAFIYSVFLKILGFKDCFTPISCPFQEASPVIGFLSDQFNTCSTSLARVLTILKHAS